jgi:O-antigen ligase
MNFILSLSNWVLFSYVFIGIISVILPGIIINLGYSHWWILSTLVGVLIFFDQGFKWLRQVLNLSWVQWIGGILLVRFCLLTGIDNYSILSVALASAELMGDSIKEFSQWVLFFGLLLVVAEKPHIREPYLLGSLIGTGISGCIALLQWWFGDLPEPFSLGSFWLHLNRMRGTFTDPNALGVTAALLLPLLAKRWIFIFPIFAGAMLSGSRSFFLGLSVVALIGLVSLIRKRISVRYSTNLIILSLLVILVSLVLILVQFVHPSYLPFWIPTSVVRLIETFNWSTAAQAWSSRGIFWQIAIRMWYESPLFGVGFGTFRQELPAYAQMLGIDLKGWLDNSNSFYLGTLAEQGIVGACLFGYLIWQLVGKSKEVSLVDSTGVIKESRLAALLLLVLLIVGPHLSFTEVSMTAAVLLSPLVARSFTRRYSVGSFIVTFSLIICVIWYEFRKDRGFFDWESDQGRFYRWTSARAVVWLPCSGDGISHLFLRSGYPKGNFVVMVANLKKTLFPGVWTEVRVPCDSNRLNQSISGAFSPIIIRVLSPWRPSETLTSEDTRWLGVQVGYYSMLQRDSGSVPKEMFPSLRWRLPSTSVIW